MNNLPIEWLVCTWSLVYGLTVLSLTLSVDDDDDHPKQIDVRQMRNFHPLLFLTGAKLLTIFCYNLPFAWLAIQYFHLTAAAYMHHNVDATKTFNHLIVLMCTRCVLGIFTIFDDIIANRHDANANHLSAAICLTILLCATVFVLTLLLNEQMMTALTEYFVQMNYEFGVGVAVSAIYVLLSICIDSIGHTTTIVSTTSSIYSFGKRTQSLMFASCVEHLIDVGFVVIYLNRLMDTRLILMAMCFCGLTIAIQTILNSPTTTMTTTNTNFYPYQWLTNVLQWEII